MCSSDLRTPTTWPSMRMPASSMALASCRPRLATSSRVCGSRLALALSQAMDGVGHCRLCRTLTEDDLCPQCADVRRDDTLLCVVEGPMDVYAVEQTGYRGRYFVLNNWAM